MTTIATGTFTIDFKFRPKEDRAGAMVGGRVRMGPRDCLVRPQDIGLRTIKSLVVTSVGSRVEPVGSFTGYSSVVLTTYIGSMGVLDTSTTAATPIGNYARIRAARIGSQAYVGTSLAGSILVSFMAFGD